MDIALRQQVCRLVAGLVVADDDLDDAEDAFIDRVLARFEIDGEGREVIFPIVDRTEAAVAFRALPADVQLKALDLLLEASAIDGKVVADERAYLETVGEVIGLDKAAIDQRITAALAARSSASLPK